MLGILKIILSIYTFNLVGIVYGSNGQANDNQAYLGVKGKCNNINGVKIENCLLNGKELNQELNQGLVKGNVLSIIDEDEDYYYEEDDEEAGPTATFTAVPSATQTQYVPAIPTDRIIRLLFGANIGNFFQLPTAVQDAIYMSLVNSILRATTIPAQFIVRASATTVSSQLRGRRNVVAPNVILEIDIESSLWAAGQSLEEVADTIVSNITRAQNQNTWTGIIVNNQQQDTTEPSLEIPTTDKDECNNNGPNVQQFFFEQNECRPCLPGCASCDDTETCLSCKENLVGLYCLPICGVNGLVTASNLDELIQATICINNKNATIIDLLVNVSINQTLTFEDVEFEFRSSMRASLSGDYQFQIVKAIENSNITFKNITFENGLGAEGGAIYFENNTVSTFESCNFFNNSVNISGGAIYFSPMGAVVNFTGCSFQNNDAIQSGGAIMFESTNYQVLFDYCNFHSNNASSNDGGAISFADGSLSSNVQFVNTQFNSNYCKVRGGALQFASNITTLFTDCEFNGNVVEFNSSSAKGGAINFDADVASNFTKVTFRGQYAYSGAAIYFKATTLDSLIVFEDCLFTEGHVLNDGGAINCETSTICKFDFLRCNFTDNRAGEEGGALEFQDHSLYFEDCLFQNNTSHEQGGCIFFKASQTDRPPAFYNCDFIGNEGSGGGALYFNNPEPNITIRRCNFINNTVDPTDTSLSGAGDAGAIEIEDAGSSLQIYDSYFYNNYAIEEGGAIFFEANDGVSLYMSNTIFIENKGYEVAGAVGFDREIIAEIYNCSFIGNIGGEGGGLFATQLVSLVIEGCEFNDNVVIGGNGGAISVEEGDTTSSITYITNSNFTNNTCSGKGGAIYTDYDLILVINTCAFEDNVAGSTGGAIFVGDLAPYFANTQFSNNTQASNVNNDIYADMSNPRYCGPNIYGSVLTPLTFTIAISSDCIAYGLPP